MSIKENHKLKNVSAALHFSLNDEKKCISVKKAQTIIIL